MEVRRRDQECYENQLKAMAVRQQELEALLRHDPTPATVTTHENPGDDFYQYTGPWVPPIASTRLNGILPQYQENWVPKNAYGFWVGTTQKLKTPKDTWAIHPLTKDE